MGVHYSGATDFSSCAGHVLLTKYLRMDLRGKVCPWWLVPMVVTSQQACSVCVTENPKGSQCTMHSVQGYTPKNLDSRGPTSSQYSHQLQQRVSGDSHSSIPIAACTCLAQNHPQECTPAVSCPHCPTTLTLPWWPGYPKLSVAGEARLHLRGQGTAVPQGHFICYVTFKSARKPGNCMFSQKCIAM